MFENVASSRPKGSRKGAMVKEDCFLPLKTRKALDLQGLFVLGCKTVAPIWHPIFCSAKRPGLKWRHHVSTQSTPLRVVAWASFPCLAPLGIFLRKNGKHRRHACVCGAEICCSLNTRQISTAAPAYASLHPALRALRQRSYQLSSHLLEQMAANYGIIGLCQAKEKQKQKHTVWCALFLAPPAGLEPATSCINTSNSTSLRCLGEFSLPRSTRHFSSKKR